MIVCYTQIFGKNTIAYRENPEDNIQYIEATEDELVKTICSLNYKLKDNEIRLVGNSVFCEKYVEDIKEYSMKNYGLNPEELEIEVK